MPGANQFYTRDPHHKAAKFFGSHKQKPDMPIIVDNKSHRPNTLNFSRPRASKRVTKARATTMPTIQEKPLPPSCEVPLHLDVEVDIRHVTTVQETKVNEKMWHIAYLFKTFVKQMGSNGGHQKEVYSTNYRK